MSLDVERNPLGPGDIAGKRYRLERRIASGGMGEVYKARDSRTGRQVAIKFPHPDRLSDPRTFQRFVKEAKATACLNDDHCVAVYDACVARERPFLVMELLNGDSLRALLNASGRFSVQRAVNLVLQASAGIAAAHSVGVIHRDLKPENLMVTQILYVGEHLKVLDFGVARLNGSGTTTTTGAVMGTPHYMSPEQAKGDAEIDERTDVYALGAVLYELISGTKAHPGEAYNKIIYHVLSANVPPLGEVCPEVPRRLSDIVDKCLAKDPSERFASMKALARALQTFAVNEQGEIDLTSVDLGDATLAYSSPQSASRRRWAWFGLIGAVCFGGGYAAARTQPPRVEGHADTHRQIASSSESVREHQPLSASAAQHADDAPPSTPQVDARPTPATLPRSPADDTSQRQLKSHPMRQFPRRVHRPEV